MDSAFLEREWAVIAGAPFIIIGGAVALIGVVWFFVNWMRSQEVSGAKEQTEAWKARWELLHDKLAAIEEKNITLVAAVDRLDTQIKARAPIETLSTTSASLTGISHGLQSANTELEDWVKKSLTLKVDQRTDPVMPTLDMTIWAKKKD